MERRYFERVFFATSGIYTLEDVWKQWILDLIALNPDRDYIEPYEIEEGFDFEGTEIPSTDIGKAIRRLRRAGPSSTSLRAACKIYGRDPSPDTFAAVLEVLYARSLDAIFQAIERGAFFTVFARLNSIDTEVSYRLFLEVTPPLPDEYGIVTEYREQLLRGRDVLDEPMVQTFQAEQRRRRTTDEATARVVEALREILFA